MGDASPARGRDCLRSIPEPVLPTQGGDPPPPPRRNRTPAVLLSACSAGTAPEERTARAAVPAVDGPRTTLVIGSVSDDREEEAEVFQPFIDHVAAQLEPAGVTGGDVVVAGTPRRCPSCSAAARSTSTWTT